MDSKFPIILAGGGVISVRPSGYPSFGIGDKYGKEAGWESGRAVYDYAKEVKEPWKVLLEVGGFPAIFSAEYGEGVIIFNSVLVGETLSKVELREAIELGQNFIQYASIVAAFVTPQAKLATTWGSIKEQ